MCWLVPFPYLFIGSIFPCHCGPFLSLPASNLVMRLTLCFLYWGTISQDVYQQEVRLNV